MVIAAVFLNLIVHWEVLAKPNWVNEKRKKVWFYFHLREVFIALNQVLWNISLEEMEQSSRNPFLLLSLVDLFARF